MTTSRETFDDRTPSGLHRLAVALQLLTRYPVRLSSVTEDDLRDACAFFPLVGVVVAAPGIAARALLDPLVGSVPATIAAVGAMVIATGAFHEDGLADTADGLWGGSTPERRAEIMKDSRIGTYGAAALVLGLAFRVSLYARLDLGRFAMAAIAGHVLARAAGVALAYRLQPLRDGSLAARATPRGRGTPALVCAAAVSVSVAACGRLFVLPLAAVTLMVLSAGSIAAKKLGGVTGDVLGAVNQISELAVLTVVVATSLHGWR